MKIRTKLFIFVFMIVLVSLGILTLVFVGLAQKNLKQQVVAHLETTAQDRAGHIETYLKNHIQFASLVAGRSMLKERFDDFNQNPSEEKRKVLNEMLKDSLNSVSGIRRMCLLNNQGIVVACTDNEEPGKDYSSEEFFLKSEEGAGGYFIDISGTKYFAASSPVVVDGRFIGVEMNVLSPDELKKIIDDRTGLGETGEVDIAIFSDGESESGCFSELMEEQNKQLKNFSDSPPMEAALAGQKNVFDHVKDCRGNEVVAVSRFIETGNIGLVAKMNTAEAYRLLDRMEMIGLGIFLILALLALVAVWFFSFGFTQSLNELIEEIGSIPKNNLSPSFSKKIKESNDEIGILAKKFISMTNRLRILYRGLRKNVRELEKSKAKDEAVISSIGDGLVVTDKKGIIVLVNPAFEKMLGWKMQEIGGKKLSKLIPMFNHRNKSIPEKNRPVERILGSDLKKTVSVDARYQTKDGSVLAVAATASPILHNGKIIGAVKVFRDITKEKEIDKAKTEFVSLASHQLRTPLSAVKWYAEMLLAGNGGDLKPRQKAYANEIYSANQRMIDLVNKLLNISRLETGTYLTDPETADIVSVCRPILAELSHQAKAKDIDLKIEFEKNLPSIKIDQKLLQAVIHNLISNAIKYTGKGGQVRFSVIWDKKNQEMIFKIADSGIGIPENQQKEIFAKFFRADNARSQETDGTGLGLYIVKSIIDHSGGKIWFESKQNEGTTFFFSLPKSGMKKRKGSRPLI